MLNDTYQGETRCPQRVGEMDATLPSIIWPPGKFFTIVFGEADPPTAQRDEIVRSPPISAASQR
jgi:hypothetical protein